jgi:hypothetical protein
MAVLLMVTPHILAIFENYVAEIRLDGKPVQLALWDTAYVQVLRSLVLLGYSSRLIPFAHCSGQEAYEVCKLRSIEIRKICINARDGGSLPRSFCGC